MAVDPVLLIISSSLMSESSRLHALLRNCVLSQDIYPLHTGELRGIAMETLNAMLGLAVVSLGVTGLWLWWTRRA